MTEQTDCHSRSRSSLSSCGQQVSLPALSLLAAPPSWTCRISSITTVFTLHHPQQPRYFIARSATAPERGCQDHVAPTVKLKIHSGIPRQMEVLIGQPGQSSLEGTRNPPEWGTGTLWACLLRLHLPYPQHACEQLMVKRRVSLFAATSWESQSVGCLHSMARGTLMKGHCGWWGRTLRGAAGPHPLPASAAD